MHRSSWFLVVALLVAVPACARNRGAAANAPGPEAAVRPVRIHVVNNYKDAMEVFAIASGTTQRLGLVAAGLSADFTLFPSLVGGGKVEFRAQPSGYGQIVQSDQLVVRPGNIVDFEIATNLIGSRANVRP